MMKRAGYCLLAVLTVSAVVIVSACSRVTGTRVSQTSDDSATVRIVKNFWQASLDKDFDKAQSFVGDAEFKMWEQPICEEAPDSTNQESGKSRVPQFGYLAGKQVWMRETTEELSHEIASKGFVLSKVEVFRENESKSAVKVDYEGKTAPGVLWKFQSYFLLYRSGEDWKIFLVDPALTESHPKFATSECEPIEPRTVGNK